MTLLLLLLNPTTKREHGIHGTPHTNHVKSLICATLRWLKVTEVRAENIRIAIKTRKQNVSHWGCPCIENITILRELVDGQIANRIDVLEAHKPKRTNKTMCQQVPKTTKATNICDRTLSRAQRCLPCNTTPADVGSAKSLDWLVGTTLCCQCPKL